MIQVQYLKELRGAQKYGSCNSCGKWSEKDPAMVRVRFTLDGRFFSTIFLCDECRKLLYKNNLRKEKEVIEEIRVVLDEGAYMPERSHYADAGLDLRARQTVTIPPGGSAAIDTGVHMEIPEGYFGKLESKSGLNVKHSVVSHGGVIDSGYIGSIVAKLYNHGKEPFVFQKGDKCIQIIIQPCENRMALMKVDRLEETERGNDGFGSTGR